MSSRLPSIRTPIAWKARRKTAAAFGRLWFHLSHGKLAGLEFARNYPVMIDESTGFIADFAHVQAAVIIEVDNGLPDNRKIAQEQAARDAICMEAGWRIIRLWRQEVEDNLEGCLLQIRYAVEGRLGRRD